jgi:hypothetical protein
MKQGNKIIGIYTVYITLPELSAIRFISNHVTDKLLEELKKDDSSDLFSYEVISVKADETPDFFGINYTVVFEFVPNKELVEELKLLAERMEVGL